jgi:hypothetical protein
MVRMFVVWLFLWEIAAWFSFCVGFGEDTAGFDY